MQATSIVDILWSRGLNQQNRPAYSFLHSRSAADSLTYGQLADAVRQLAVWLHEAAGGYERAVLVYPPGLDFVLALFGCMAAGLVPIPVYPLMGAKPDRSLLRIRHVASDADAKLILTTSALLPALLLHLDEVLPGHACMATDQVPKEDTPHTGLSLPDADDIALLQYTSGSTASPRGVTIRHRNLLANSAAIYQCYGLNSETHVVSWLPPYHDMGLIGGIVQPLFGGFPVTLMAPHSFLQNPLRWLEAISETRATTSPSPNFGYDLCVRKVDAEAAARLDLSRWKAAICGAERVRTSTLEQFADKFAAAGFSASAFCPSYGLAEGTLLIAASVGTSPVIGAFDREGLESGVVKPPPEAPEGARLLVGNGAAAPGIQIRIVDPDSLEICPEGSTGEVWVSGPSVSSGYWNKPELNKTTFEARLAGSAEGPFLRTGDTGFFQDGQLFIAGRIKDLIILAGKNHVPEDIEAAVRESDAAFKGMMGAAFSVDLEGLEVLVIAQEIQRHAVKAESAAENIFRQIQSALFRENVRADAIVLVKTGTIPRTSSGKVQRHQCRKDFIQNKLQVSAEWLSPRIRRAMMK